MLTTTSQILLDKNFTLFSWWNLSFPFCVQLIYKNFMMKSFFFFPRPTYTKRSTRNEHWRLILEFVTLKIFIYMHVEIYKIQLIWIFLVFICKPVFIFFVFYCVYVCFTQIIRHCSKIPFITCPPSRLLLEQLPWQLIRWMEIYWTICITKRRWILPK